MAPAEYCKLCDPFLYQWDACPYPGKSILWMIISLLPSAIAYLFGLTYLFTLKFRHIKVFILMQMDYLIGNKIMKHILKDLRPQSSCKNNYGMPSSHMSMLAAFCMLRLYNSPYILQKILWMIVLILEGFSRLQLNYHTPIQIFVGILVGVIFYYGFELVWKVCEDSIPYYDEEYDVNQLGLKIEEDLIIHS